MRNRAQLTEVVSSIRELAAPIVDPADLDDFVAMATNELHKLHDGNLARYRLRLGEFRRWHAKRLASNSTGVD